MEIETLRGSNTRLVREISDLRQSPRAIERLAREELGLAHPDETVFLIREDSRAPRPERRGFENQRRRGDCELRA